MNFSFAVLGDPHQREVFASGGVDIAGSGFDRAIIEKRMLSHFGYGRVRYQPEIMEMIQAIPDWMALPELGTPINKNILDKAIQAGISPVQMKALQGLIYNDLAFTFYNRVEAEARSPCPAMVQRSSASKTGILPCGSSTPDTSLKRIFITI